MAAEKGIRNILPLPELRPEQNFDGYRFPSRRNSFFIATIIILGAIMLLHTEQNSLDVVANKSVGQLKSQEIPIIRANATNYPGAAKHKRNRLLIYITTHWSTEHSRYIQYCWPEAIKHLEIFRDADIAVFSTLRKTSKIEQMQRKMSSLFNYTNLTIYQYPMETVNRKEGRWEGWNEKQLGAVLALLEAGAQGYFDSYEWVIRLNPDVMIRKDDWLLQTMFPKSTTNRLFSKKRKQPSLLYVDCLSKDSFHMHTDFFALRPAALPPGTLANADTPHAAEPSFTKAMECIRSSSIQIPGTEPVSPGQCRVVGETVYHKTKPYIDEIGRCPVNYGDEVEVTGESQDQRLVQVEKY